MSSLSTVSSATDVLPEAGSRPMAPQADSEMQGIEEANPRDEHTNSKVVGSRGDGLPSAASSSGLKRQASAPQNDARKLMRRGSLEKREASSRAKEGNRHRRRWENDRLLNNPHAEPPLPSDWEIRPTYPRRTIPYYLAPLWDAAEFQRAIESKLNASKRRKTMNNRRKRNGHIKDDSIDQFNVGISPMEEAASSIPKEIRARLKHARSAKGLLQDLEEDVRRFVRDWNQQELRLLEQGLADAPLPVPKSLSLRLKSELDQDKSNTSKAMHKLAKATAEDEEDEEIVFVGRNGAMHDMPPSPDRGNLTKSTRHHRINSTDTFDDDGFRSDHSDYDGEKIERFPEPGSSSIIATEKLIFQALESDKGASFARWLVHCVGSYYGLRTWSITRHVEGQLKREAYVGVDSRARGMLGTGVGMARCVDHGDRKEIELPQPLWGMV